MKIPIHVFSAQQPSAAVAVLIPSHRSAELFAIIHELGLDRIPPIHRCAEGFVVRLPREVPARIVGAVRLRMLTEHLNLPADGELSPPLLDDEARGLVRDRGLLFLPGGRVLEVSKQPIALGDLLEIESARTRTWDAWPELPTLAEELQELRSSVPPQQVVAILEQGRGDMSSRPPDLPPSEGIGQELQARAQFRIGQFLTWFGQMLGLGGLAGRGAKMLQQAVKMAPRLSERLMNAQEGALRKLLQDFREGKVDEALQRALPLGGDPSAPASLAGDAQLPRHNLFFTVQNLLGGAVGAASAWFAPGDVYFALQNEYRKQAEEAMRRGDAKRAAFIYGKLLNDFTSAARVLSRGGLHREAAIVYEEVLKNRLAAAQEWAAAGEIERAVEIYEQLGEDVAAATLLESVQERDKALVLYQRAADKMVRQEKYQEAGDLLQFQARRLDLALPVYANGWARRPHPQAVACGFVLAQHYCRNEDGRAFLQLLNEAEPCVAEIWSASVASHFLNSMVRLGNRPTLKTISDEVEDRCLMMLAGKMRSEGNQNDAKNGVFFGADTPWAMPVVRDAHFALEGAWRSPSRRLAVEVARLGRSTVTACRFMPNHGEVFVGFANGELLRFNWLDGSIQTIRTVGERSVAAMWSHPQESMLIALLHGPGRPTMLTALRGWNFGIEELPAGSGGTTVLCQPADNEGNPYYGAISASEHGGKAHVKMFQAGNRSIGHTMWIPLSLIPRAGVTGLLPDDSRLCWLLLFFENGLLLLTREEVLQTIPIPHDARLAPHATLRHPWIQAWQEEPSHLNVAWAAIDGSRWTLRIYLGRSNDRPVPHRDTRLKADVACLYGVGDIFLPENARQQLIAQLTRAANDGVFTNPVSATIAKNGDVFVLESNGVLLRLH